MTDKLTIITNNQPRHVLYWHELTAKEQAEFDYLVSEDRQLEAYFACYKGHVYDLGEFIHCNHPDSKFNKWHGYATDTYFSGVLIRYPLSYGHYDMESVVFGRYYS